MKSSQHKGAGTAGRRVWALLGALFLVLAAIGIALPLLPTTPFLLLSAYCFSRGSRRMHEWLTGHRVFGPPIRNWQDHRAISTSSKIWGVTAIALTFALSVVLDVPPWALTIEAIILSAVALFLITRASHSTPLRAAIRPKLDNTSGTKSTGTGTETTRAQANFSSQHETPTLLKSSAMSNR